MGTSHPDRGSAALVARPADAPAPPAVEEWPAELAALYRERRTALVRVAYLLTSDAEAAEEVVDGAVLALRARWAHVDAPRAYLQKAVIERSRTWLRRHPARSRPRGEVTPAGERGTDALWDALAALGEKERTAVVLRLYADLPEEAIAATLGCRPAAVPSLVDRGLARMQQELGP